MTIIWRLVPIMLSQGGNKVDMKKLNKNVYYIILSCLIISILCSIGDYLIPRETCAQQPVCIPYAPVVKELHRPWTNVGSNTPCITQPEIVDFNQALVGEPIVALRAWHFRFNNGDHHYDLGSIRIMGSAGMDSSSRRVVFQVEVCFRDTNGDDPWGYEYWYTVGAWPAQ